MSDKPKRSQSEKGLSAGVLAVVFLIWAGICAVFFSLGFLVGYNEQSSKLASLTERVAEPSAVPPLVSSPHRSSDSRTKESKVFSPPPSGGSTDSDEVVTQASPPAAPSKAAGSAAADQDSETQSVTPSASQGQKLREVGMGYTVQVDALRAKGDAEVIVKILKERHYPVFLVAPEYSNTRDNLYRVQVGPFASRDDADKVRTKLAKEGFKPFVRR
jgi:cell division septation protein DedD